MVSAPSTPARFVSPYPTVKVGKKVGNKRALNRLTALQVKNAKKVGRLADGGGLYLCVGSGGAKSWIFMFQWYGKRKEMGLGGTDTVDLIEARSAASDARKLVHNAVNPIDQRKAMKEEARLKDARAETFGEFADRYIDTLTRSPKTLANWKRTATIYAKALRPVRIDQITTDDIVAVLTPTLKATPEAGTKAIRHLEHIFNAAKVKKLLQGDNPARWKDHLEHSLEKPSPLSSKGHRPALPYQDITAFMAKLRGHRTTGARALEFTILTVVRTGEAIGTPWKEIDLEKKVWTIPAVRMKQNSRHRVPLSDDAVELLKALPRSKKPTEDDYLFPGGKKGKHLSVGGMTSVLRNLGVPQGKATVHGFRSTFRDWVGNETDHPSELAEIALAHKSASETEAAYWRGDALDKRMPLMSDWASFCLGRPTLKRPSSSDDKTSKDHHEESANTPQSSS